MLCDCPGLVFPSFANSRAEMMCCGVLPIDKMREFTNPIALLLKRIPKEVLEAHYKIKLPPRDDPRLYTVSFFLQTYAAKKGWYTGRTLPNESQAAKHILKEYTTGKLTFCMIRPDFDPEIHTALKQCGFNVEIKEEEEASSQAYEEIKREEPEENSDSDQETAEPSTTAVPSATEVPSTPEVPTSIA